MGVGRGVDVKGGRKVGAGLATGAHAATAMMRNRALNPKRNNRRQLMAISLEGVRTKLAPASHEFDDGVSVD